jgi:Zn2+/Cd2+-exporting ATPase
MSVEKEIGCDCGHQKQNSASDHFLVKHWKPVLSMGLLLTGLVLDYLVQTLWFSGAVRIAWYTVAYLPVGFPVLKQAYVFLKKGEVFTEFFLMGIATIGAFLIGEYPEGVAVMLFYSIGEAFQHNAVQRARSNIQSLLDVRPETAHVLRGNVSQTVHPKSVNIGETIRVKPGERVPLDGRLLTDRAPFDTSAITGESKPRHFDREEKVLAGMVNLNRVIELEVTSTYENSSISRILELVQTATLRKAKTELFIRSFAKIYTPAVVALAALLVLLPALFVSQYVFQDWLYRGLVFLVISCPCALVISIPLGYFGGIGAASRNGILVKGSNFLDALKSVTTVVFDKTGTLTKGNFTVQQVLSKNSNTNDLLKLVHAVEKNSNHPIAKAVIDYIGEPEGSLPLVKNQSEIAGFGITAEVDGKKVLLGSKKLMDKHQVIFNGLTENGADTVIHVAVDGVHEGSIVISDEIKEDSVRAVKKLYKLGIRNTVMLSGDKVQVARQIGRELNIGEVYAELLPEQKAEQFEKLKKKYPGTIAYAGDGINDAPVLAMSDVGIAMGAMGSDVAVETADVVIQTDQPSKIATAVKIGKSTRNIVWQNITMGMGVKLLVLLLGALGLATLWEAVFADVGVALLAILNAIRIQNMNFD